jgi:transcription antitermination factor NusG
MPELVEFGSFVSIDSGPFAGCFGTVVETNDAVWVRLRDSQIVVRVEFDDVRLVPGQ